MTPFKVSGENGNERPPEISGPPLFLVMAQRTLGRPIMFAHGGRESSLRSRQVRFLTNRLCTRTRETEPKGFLLPRMSDNSADLNLGTLHANPIFPCAPPPPPAYPHIGMRVADRCIPFPSNWFRPVQPTLFPVSRPVQNLRPGLKRLQTILETESHHVSGRLRSHAARGDSFDPSVKVRPDTANPPRILPRVVEEELDWRTLYKRTPNPFLPLLSRCAQRLDNGLLPPPVAGEPLARKFATPKPRKSSYLRDQWAVFHDACRLRLHLLQTQWKEMRASRRRRMGCLRVGRCVESADVSGVDQADFVGIMRRFRHDCGSIHAAYTSSPKLVAMLGDAIAELFFGDEFKGMDVGLRLNGSVHYSTMGAQSTLGRVFMQPSPLPPRCELVVRFVEDDDVEYLSPFHRHFCNRVSRFCKLHKRVLKVDELHQMFDLAVSQYKCVEAYYKSSIEVRDVASEFERDLADLVKTDVELTCVEAISSTDVSGLYDGKAARDHNKRHPCQSPLPVTKKKQQNKPDVRGEEPEFVGPPPVRKEYSARHVSGEGPSGYQTPASEYEPFANARSQYPRGYGLFGRIIGQVPVQLNVGMDDDAIRTAENVVNAVSNAAESIARVGDVLSGDVNVKHAVHFGLPSLPTSVSAAFESAASFADSCISMALGTAKAAIDKVLSSIKSVAKTIFESRLWSGVAVACVVCAILWLCKDKICDSGLFAAFASGLIALLGKLTNDTMFEAVDVSGFLLEEDPVVLTDGIWRTLWRGILTAFGAEDATGRVRSFSSFLTVGNIIKAGAVATAASRISGAFTSIFKWVVAQFDSLFGTSLLVKLFYSGYARDIMVCVRELQSIRAGLSIYVRGGDLTNPGDLSKLALRYHAVTAKWGRLVATMKDGRVDPVVLQFIHTGNAVFDNLGRYFGSRACIERAQATLVTLTGASGVGKTTLVKHLHNSVLRRFSQFTCDDVNTQLFVLPKGAKFFDGYKNQFTTVIDELFAVREVTGGSEQPAAASLLSMVSSFVYSLNMASLEEKGTTYFNSKLVIATTNLKMDQIMREATQTLTHPEALRRRLRGFFTTVRLRPEFMDAHGELDWAKQNASDSNDVWTFQIDGSEQVLSYNEFVDAIYNDIVKNVSGSAQYMQKMMREWDVMEDTVDFRPDGTLSGFGKMSERAVAKWERLVGVANMALNWLVSLGPHGPAVACLGGLAFGALLRGFANAVVMVSRLFTPEATEAPPQATAFTAHEVSGGFPDYLAGQLVVTIEGHPNWRGAATLLHDDYVIMCRHTFIQIGMMGEDEPGTTINVHNIVKDGDAFALGPVCFTCSAVDFGTFERIIPPSDDVAIVKFPPGIAGRRVYRSLVDDFPKLADSCEHGTVMALLANVAQPDRRHSVVAIHGEHFVKRNRFGSYMPDGSITTMKNGVLSFRNWVYEVHHDSHVPVEGYSGAIIVDKGRRIFGMVCSRLSQGQNICRAGGFVALSKAIVDKWFEDARKATPAITATHVSGEFIERDPLGVDALGFLVEYDAPEHYRLSGRGKSELFKTDLARVRGTAVAPARLHRFVTSDGSVVDPKSKALASYGGPALGISPVKVSEAVSVALDPLISGLAGAQVSMVAISFEDAVRGVPGRLPSINRGTSPGVPWIFQKVKDKRAAFGYDEFTFDTDQGLAMLDEARQIEEVLFAGEDWRFVFRDFPKDEKRKKEKVLNGDTRFISSSQIAMSLIFRRHFAPILMYLRENHINNGLAQYTCCFSEWDRAVDYITNGLEWRGRIIAGDYSGFDKAQMPQILQEIGDQLSSLFADRADFIRRLWRCSVVNTLHFDGEHIYTWTKSLPSGHPLTTLINSLINLTYIVLCFVEAGNPIARFWDWVRPLVYGDDNVIGVGPHVVGFNQTTLPSLMRLWGQKYTDETKGAGDCADFRDITEVTFLKRGFRENPTGAHGAWVPALAWETIVEMGHWIRERNPDPEPLAVAIILVNAFEEAALHGECKFREFADSTRAAFSSAYSMLIPESRTYRSWWAHFEKTMQRKDLFDFEAGQDDRVQFGSEQIPGAPAQDAELTYPV